ncbi:MAG: COX15/CtaA family protein [Flavobacteriales bacterium]|jgi:cytochrome c oxidase assembly protein subunit 15|nr:COX15/CtaA family protein [Flavobacteriales bacterium]
MNSSVHLRPVVIWLLTGCAMIALMVVIGGITRLTGSGLSITEWDPIMGAMPPMDEAAWLAAFDKYKQIPEYQLVNSHMQLADFKEIFFWEWAHRNWGRLMGIVFIVPFLLFWRKRLLHGWLMKRTLWIMLGGGVVASLGWFMVLSGLVDERDANGQLLVSVSHYRLAIHLCAAFTVFCMVLWTVFDIRSGRRGFRSNGSTAGLWSRALLMLLAVQVIWGAFTAGLDAGHGYNTWPLMDGAFLPENATALDSHWLNFTARKDGVQFIHRNLAWLVAAGFIVFAWRFRGVERLPWRLLIVAVLVQFTLGVITILTQVHLALGILHQFGALLLLAALLKAMHVTGRPTPA